MNNENMAIAISILSALAATASAIYAFFQVREARNSVERAEESVREASTQNRINALVVLNEHLERELPKISALAEHFATTHTQEERRALDAEYEQTRRRLLRVSAEIEKLYEVYVLANKE